MRKVAIVMIGVIGTLFVAGCTTGSTKDNGDNVVITRKDEKAEECLNKAERLQANVESFEAYADGISTVSDAERVIARGRAIVEDGRELLAECGEYVDASDRAELEQGLDEADAALDQAERLVELYS